MRKVFVNASTGLSALLIASTSLAQTAAVPEDESVLSLEEIVITAERRTEDLQKVGGSVVAIKGGDLLEQGKVTAPQILESVPNVTFTTSRDNASPNGNITIRGVQSTQETGGGQGPSATATYVDDIYQGIGGTYDISRVEVLRGPQGTLYGRSATGGVVAFHTNDPKLSEFGASLTGEVGTANLHNASAAVNLPAGDQFAVRVAGHLYERDGYYSADGGAVKTTEGRIKALYQPIQEFKVLLSASTTEQKENSGGTATVLTSPSTYGYSSTATAAQEGSPRRSNQYVANLNYDFGGSNLTYIGALHTYKYDGQTITTTPGGVVRATINQPLDQFHTEELRWASSSNQKLTWIVGANYYANLYRSVTAAVQQTAYAGAVVDPDPATLDAATYTNGSSGSVKNYGLFTEETYALRDDLRITGGLRFDRTRVEQSSNYLFNVNLNSNGNSLKPEEYEYFELNNDVHKFNNVTYKARLEYDLTPSSMLYALTATGFLPGDAQISPNVDLDRTTNPPTLNGVNFTVLPFSQERLTSYEVGSKNRFLDGSLQLNAAAFYYKYQGYQEAINTTANLPAPTFVIIAVPVKMLGVEADVAWKLTASDTVAFSGALLDAKISSYPDLPGGLGSSQQYLAKKHVAGVPPATANLSYEHAFAFGNGSTLAPRVEARYISGGYVRTLTQTQITQGQAPYDYQSSYVIGNVGVTWKSPEQAYSVTGYVRNVTDKFYKSAVTLSTFGTLNNISVTPGDPRTVGVVVTAKF